MSSPFWAPVLLAGLLLGGCAGEHVCRPFPPMAFVTFGYAGSNATLLDEVRALGWGVTPGQNTLGFSARLYANGTLFSLRGQFSGLDPAGETVLTLEGGPVEADTDDEARRTLAFLAEPIAQRFGAEVQYRPGGRACP